MPDWEQIKKEYIVSTTRSQGAGGQHVNKVETKVRVCFKPALSKFLNEEEKERILDHLSGKLDKSGKFCINYSKKRSQLDNKLTAIKKMNELLAKALIPKKKRSKTRVPLAQKQKRIENKKARSQIKQLRKNPDY